MEMSFKTGDIIYVYGDMDEDGFFLGELNQMRGLVPSNFLTEAPPEGDIRGRRPMPPHGAPVEGWRGPGPGARGPPPPPREAGASNAMYLQRQGGKTGEVKKFIYFQGILKPMYLLRFIWLIYLNEYSY